MAHHIFYPCIVMFNAVPFLLPPYLHIQSETKFFKFSFFISHQSDSLSAPLFSLTDLLCYPSFSFSPSVFYSFFWSSRLGRVSHARGATSPVWGTGITALSSGESERVSLLKLNSEARWWSFSLWLHVLLPTLKESTHSVQGECDEVCVRVCVCLEGKGCVGSLLMSRVKEGCCCSSQSRMHLLRL